MQEGDQFESYEFDEDEGFVNDEEVGDLDINGFIDQNGWLVKVIEIT